MSDKGFIKLDRKLLNWGWKDDPNMVALWIEILLQANVKEREWHGVKFEPGSFPTSIEKLAKATGLSIQSTRTCLKKLRDSGEIFQKSTSHGTIIKVVKWAEYQGRQSSANKQLTSHQQATNKQLTTLKERKKERSKEYSLSISKGGMGEIEYKPSPHLPIEELNELLKLREEKYES